MLNKKWKKLLMTGNKSSIVYETDPVSFTSSHMYSFHIACMGLNRSKLKNQTNQTKPTMTIWYEQLNT